MKIDIIGAESLGVRGLCCFVTVGEQKILIDPGIALGFLRHGQTSASGSSCGGRGNSSKNHRGLGALPQILFLAIFMGIMFLWWMQIPIS